MGSFSDYAENKVLDHVTGKTAYTAPTVYLALCTAAVTDASLGTNITEATYTGYARKLVTAADWAAAASGETHNNTTETFAACTAGGPSTITYWALCDSATTAAGNIIMWGTCTSTVISTTQTPATVATSALSLTLD